MTTLVVGASGATGRLLVEQLLDRGQRVKIVIRSTKDLPDKVLTHKNLSLIHASILNVGDAELVRQTSHCGALASCLGHNMTFKGIFGDPRRLVTDATRRLCNAVKANNPDSPVKFVLMNTTGFINQDRDEKASFVQMGVIWLLRLLLPPHVDNENAAEYLRTEIGQNNEVIEWSAVRPDSLIDNNDVTEYSEHPSPTRSAIFDAGKTSRINVAHFMAELITNDDSWKKWKGKMPVIYNRDI